MSNASSCISSPFSSPETGAEIDVLDLPIFPTEPSIYQQILSIDTSSDLVIHQQPQQQQQQQQQQQHYQAYASAQQQKQQFAFNLAPIGLGTPPTSPPTPTYHKYQGNAEMGSVYYGSQPQTIQNVYVIPAPHVSTLLSHSPQQQLQTNQQQQTQQDAAYHLLLQQFDNLESSLFSPSPTISSSPSSSLSGSPYAADSTMLTTLGSDFTLFPTSNVTGVQQPPVGYPSAPVLAPSSQSIYPQSGVYQMTPPSHHIDHEPEVCSLFKQDMSLPLPQTTEMSLLCKCPGKFPCGEQMPEETPFSVSVSPANSPLQDIRESEYTESDSGSDEDMAEEETELDSDPLYVPSRSRGPKANGPRFMVISTATPYDSPFSKERSSSASPTTPVRQDRRRSSSGAFSSFGGQPHNQQLLAPEEVPEIKDIHVCPVCERRFTRPFNLRSHLMTHTTARPFPCDECHWKFTRQHDLLRHKRAKHPNSADSQPSPAGQKKAGNTKSRPVSAA